MAVDLEFGKPWAAAGETRPSHFRTPLAWVDGYAEGVLFVRTGEPEGWCSEGWETFAAWRDWVKRTSAAPVVPGELATPWEAP